MTSIVLYVVAYVVIGFFTGLASRSFGERAGLRSPSAAAAWGLAGALACGGATLALMHGGPARSLVYKEGWDAGTTLPAYWVSLLFALAGAILAVALRRLVAREKESRLE